MNQRNFKTLMTIPEFNRRIQAAISKRADGAVSFALENFYVGEDAILSVR